MTHKISLNWVNTGLLVIFFLAIFWGSIVPLRDPDIWFHVLSGELISKYGLVFQDYFSYTAYGREWIPYEWLFQVTVFVTQQLFGFSSIMYLMALVVTAQIAIVFLIIRKIFKASLTFSLLTSFFYWSLVYEFFTARPHVFAYTFFILTVYLILIYLNSDSHQKTFFKRTLPLFAVFLTTIIWSNLHGSMFLSYCLTAGYSFVAFLHYWIEKKKQWLIKAKDLFVFTILSLIATILPPLGFSQYRLLIKFYQYKDVLTRFIDEWTPLALHSTGFDVYLSIFAAVFLISLFTLFKTRNFKKVLILLPVLPIPLLAFLAVRNVALGYLTLALITGWCLSLLDFKNISKLSKWIVITILIISSITAVWLVYQKRLTDKLYYPVYAAQFLKNHHLNGNMFNEYGSGGYLLYQLYPDYKVFFDGRTEMFLCCEIPETMQLAYHKADPDQDYTKTLNWLWDKHQISFVVIGTEKHSLLRKIARILTDDSNWSLVYWDDYTQIFVRHDGKNDAILKQFAVTAATPYNQDPYRPGTEEQAMKEYQQMIQVTDSSKSRNAIGYLLLKKQQYAQAALEFQKAVDLDPTNESPLMNLAELSAKDKNYSEAIDYYQKALYLAPDRGLIYIRLGQLYLQNGDSLDSAKNIWQQGVENTVDDEAKKKLLQLLAAGQ